MHKMDNLHPYLHEINYWLYLNACRSVEESETNCLTKECASHHMLHVLSRLNNRYKQWQSASFRVTGLFILFTGIVFPLKNNATPCGVSMLLQRLNQLTEEVKRQGTTTGNASWYRGQRAGGCLIWPFVCTAAYSSEQNGRGEDKSISSSTRCIASSRPHSNSCSCMPLVFEMCIGKCGAYHSNQELRAVSSLQDACIMPKMSPPAYRRRTVRRKGQWSGIK